MKRGNYDMGIPVLVLGESGSGKSASLRNFQKDDILVLNVASKPLPFRNKNKIKMADKANYDMIKQVAKSGKALSYVVDDANLIMTFEAFKRAKETGFTKFTEMGCDYESMVRFIIEETPKDTIVYLNQHTDTDENGKIKAKTIGKMLDSMLTVESLFTIVLHCVNDAGTHKFVTNSRGESTAKTPMEMFETNEIDNDLKLVDDAIREYYGLKKQGTNKTTQEQNEQ